MKSAPVLNQVLLATVLLAGPVAAADGNIVMLFGEDCDLQLGSGCRTRMQVWGLLQGASAGGFTGAEYRIEVPVFEHNNWLFSETFEPGALVIGAGAIAQPNAIRGVNVAFPTCQTGDGFRVLLESVDILRLDTSFPHEVILRVVKHDRPSSQFFQCPLFTLCDAPVYTKVCLGSNLTTCQNPEPPFANNATCSTSGQALINGRECCLSCTPGVTECTVGIESRAWSGVKALYR